MILLREGQPAKDAESWIRLENGTRIDQGLASANEIAASQQAACDGSAPVDHFHLPSVHTQHQQHRIILMVQ